MSGTTKPKLALAVYLTVLLAFGGYFALASVQGEFGLFRSVQLEAEITDLTAVRDALQAQVDEMANKTQRLSDEFLDLDLLDERARDVLGLVRSDEIVIY